MDVSKILNDNGFRSRKFLLAFYSIHLIVGLGFASIHWKELAPDLEVLIGGILGVLGLYYTGNVAHRATVTKNLKPKDGGGDDSGNPSPDEG